MTKIDDSCPAYDQILNRSCRYHAGHGGRHNFAPLDHNTALECDLRRALDEMTKARDEACDIADTAIQMRGDFLGRRNQMGSDRIVELRKVGA